MAVDRGLVVLGQSLQSGGVAGLRLDGGDQVDEVFRLLPGDDGTDGDFLAVYRRVDDAVLVQRLQQLVLPSPLGAGEVRGGDALHPAYTGGAVYQQLSRLKHDKCLLTQSIQKNTAPATGLTSGGTARCRYSIA